MSVAIDYIKRYPLVIVSLAVLMFSVITGFVRGGIIEELESQEIDVDGRASVIEKNKVSASGLSEDLAMLEKQVASINERTLDPNKRAQNTNFFYAFEDEVDVLITSVNQLTNVNSAFKKGGARELKEFTPISYDIALEGTFVNLLAVMYKLHDAKILMRITDFQISEANRSAISGALSAKFNVVALARKEVAQ
ncbi:MAG: hypothetical protein ACSHYA_15705 [Opitutaceae bacterium]